LPEISQIVFPENNWEDLNRILQECALDDPKVGRDRKTCEMMTLKEIIIRITISRISYPLREIYPINRCCWNVAAYEWKAYHEKIGIISVFVFSSLTGPHSFIKV
jgi:hypothetical protein